MKTDYASLVRQERETIGTKWRTEQFHVSSFFFFEIHNRGQALEQVCPQRLEAPSWRFSRPGRTCPEQPTLTASTSSTAGWSDAVNSGQEQHMLPSPALLSVPLLQDQVDTVFP